MITYPLTIKVSGFTGTYEYLFYDANDTGNVIFSVVSGTSEISQSGAYNTITTFVQFNNYDDLVPTDLRVRITRPDGCVTEIPLTIPDVCTSIVSIARNGNLSFFAKILGNAPYEYEWEFNQTRYYSLNGINESTLELAPRPGFTPENQISITLNVVDSYGCEYSVTTQYDLCAPLSGNGNAVLTCSTEGGSTCSGVFSSKVNFRLDRLVQACPGTSIVWENTELNASSPDICVENHNNGKISIYCKNKNGGIYTLMYRVYDNTGLSSDDGLITISAPVCTSTDQVMSGAPAVEQVTAATNVNDVITIPTENRVYSPNGVDWSTWNVITSPTYGSVSLNADREIEYTVLDLTNNIGTPDAFTWAVSDNIGNSVTVTDVITRNPLSKPILSTDTICTTCGSVVTNVDILANDSGDIDRSTVYIKQSDADLTWEKNSDGTFTVTVSNSALFNNIAKYNVKNHQGIEAETDGSIVVSAVCAGQPVASIVDVTCIPNNTINLGDYVQNANGLSYTWTETTPDSPTYTSQGGSIGAGLDGQINLNGLVAKDYTFKLTATGAPPCDTTTDETEVTVRLQATPSLAITGITHLGNGVVKVDFAFATIVEGSLNVLVDGGSPNYLTNPSLNTNTGTGSFVVTVSTGATHTVTITANDICGNILTDTDSVVT